MARFSQKTSVITCALWLLCAQGVQAQNEQLTEDNCTRDRECARHYLQARTLSRSGQLADALEEYHSAYASQQVPTLLFNIARLNHKLGRLKEALSAYEAYLRQDVGSDLELKVKAKEYLTQIRAQNESPSLSLQPTSLSPSTPIEPPQVKSVPVSTIPPPHTSSIVHSGSNSTQSGVNVVPVYKKWWLWTTIGTVIVASVAGIIIGTQADPRPVPDATSRFP